MSLVALVVNPTRANTPPRRAASLRQSGFCVSMRHPLVPSHELKPEPVVVDTQVSVAAARDRFRHDFRNFLRHHADIGGVVVPLVAEAVDADAVVEPSERDNVLLQADIGATAVPAGAVRGNAGWPVRGPGMSATAGTISGHPMRRRARAIGAETSLIAWRPRGGALVATADARRRAMRRGRLRAGIAVVRLPG